MSIETAVSPVQTPLEASRNQPKAKTTILLVEDERFVREVTAEVLTGAGYRVVKARTANEALATLRDSREDVHLLLTDVVLPGQSGRDLARESRRMQPALKTIFVSGYPENEIAKRGLFEPGAFYLPKPFSTEALVRKVAEVMSESREAAPQAMRAAGGE